MIEGLKYHFSSQELVQHMRDRSNYHTGRATEKTAAMPEMKAALEKIRSQTSPTKMSGKANFSNYQVDRPDDDLEADIQAHKNKALVFRTLADHVVPNETYVLGESDLVRLEILLP
jgi:hypothetical protein